MKVANFYNFCKIFCIIFCACFMLSACGDDTSDNNSNTFVKANCEQTIDGRVYNECALKQNSCWQSTLIKAVYGNLGDMTKNVYDQIANDSARNLVLLVFIVWMLFQILRHVATTSPESLGEFWTKIMRKGALCVICAIFASSPQYVYAALNTFVFPVYMTVLEFTGELMKIMGKNETGAILLAAQSIPDNELICEAYVNNFDNGCQINSAVQFTAEGFPDEPEKMMECMACSVNDRLSSGYNIATQVLKSSLFTGWIAGIFLVIAFTLAKFGFVLYLLDSIFRMDMMILCVPFLIMFYPFEQTRKWTVKGFKIIISSSIIMMCLGVIIATTISAMEYLLTGFTVNGEEFQVGDPQKYKNLGLVPMIMIFMGMIILKASAISLEMANAISGYTNNANLQKKLVGLIQTIGKTVLTICTMGGGKVVTTVVEMSERLQALRNKMSKDKNKSKASASLMKKN